MRRKIGYIAGAIVAFVLTCTLGAYAEAAPSAAIVSKNVSYSDSVKMIFAVEAENCDSVALQIFAEDTTEFDDAHVQYTVTDYTPATVKGKPAMAFYSKGISAKNYTDSFFARVKATGGGSTVYSGILRYSVVQYLRDRLALTTNTYDQIELYHNLARYGASAQKVLKYRTDRLATDDFFDVNVVGGSFADGESTWLLHADDTVTLTATPQDGEGFAYWSLSDGKPISYEAALDVTVTGAATYTAHLMSIDQYPELRLSSDGTYYRVVGVGGATAPVVMIPAAYNGKPVKEIAAQAFNHCETIQSVLIPNTVTTVGDFAFANCPQLTALNLPDSVKNIGIYAFSGDGALETVDLGKVTSIGESAFANCRALTEITFPDGMTEIAKETLYGCTALRTVNIPASVTNIGSMAIYFDTMLDNVNFDGTMQQWSDIEKGSLSFPTYGYHYTVFCTDGNIFLNGESERFSAGLAYTTGEYELLTASGIGTCTDTDIVLPAIYHGKAVASISASAFKDCDTITLVTVQNSTTEIKDYAFDGCDNLKSITLPDNLQSIGTAALAHCPKLTDINYGNSLNAWQSVNKGLGWNLGSDSITVYCTDGCVLPDGTELRYSTGLDIEVGATVCTVKGMGSCTDTDVVIPQKVNDKPVKEIAAQAFNHCETIQSVLIPDTVTTIGDYAFANCSSLKTVNIPDGVHSIMGYTFRGCTSLTSVTGGNGITYIYPDAFSGCTALTAAPLHEGLTVIESYAFEDCLGLTEITAPSTVNEIGYCAFTGCENLQRVTLNEGLTVIGNETFENCSGLAEITLPGTLTTIEYEAFYRCGQLMTIRFNGTTAEWGNVAKGNDWDLMTNAYSVYCTDGIVTKFGKLIDPVSKLQYRITTRGCSIEGRGLSTASDIVIPSSVGGHTVTEIGGGAFSDDVNIITVQIPDTVTEIGGYAFRHCSKLESINIPDGVNIIDDYTFADCHHLHAVTGGKDVERICRSAFFDCTGLETVPLYDGLTTIEQDAFVGSGITELHIPGSADDIAAAAFKNCWNLASVTVGEGVRDIPAGLFDNCLKLTEVTLPHTLATIGDEAFVSCSNLESIYFNGTTAEWNAIDKEVDWDFAAGDYTVYCTNGKILPDGRIIGDSEGLAYTFTDNACYLTGMGTCTDTEIIVPKSVNGLPVTKVAGAFESNTEITSVKLPDTVTEISAYAFGGCRNLETVNIPGGVEIIQPNTFRSCQSLAEITLPDSVTEICSGAFYGCTKLKSMTVNEGVTAIDDRAFFGCNALTELNLPHTLTTIGEEAFSSCTALVTVNYNGTLAEWASVHKDFDWDMSAGSYIVYCTDGIVDTNGHALPYSTGLTLQLQSNGTYEIRGAENCTGNTLVIPAEYEGIPITSLKSLGNILATDITEVVLGKNLDYIDSYVFDDYNDVIKKVYLTGNGVWVCDDDNERLTAPDSDPEIVAKYFTEWRPMYAWYFEKN